ncbi:MAG: MBL fold metallo-hydrolase [Janthinobacterium lividum]
MTAAFLQRDFPSANSVLLEGPLPVLVDTGAPGDDGAVLAWLNGRRPVLVVNTHWHSDHTGGNQAWSRRGVPIAAAEAEAVIVNAGDLDACRSRWLRQQVPPYRVDQMLNPGAILNTGTASWQVVGLPGHTAAQIGLFEPVSGVLVAGDAVHESDLGWLDLDADPTALEGAAASLDLIAALGPRLMLSGHGPAITDVPGALQRARRRLASWREQPERIAWHACKRILGHLLFTEGGLARSDVPGTLLDAPWFRDHAVRAFGLAPGAFVPLLIEEMIRSGAAGWRGNRLVAGAGQSSEPRR